MNFRWYEVFSLDESTCCVYWIIYPTRLKANIGRCKNETGMQCHFTTPFQIKNGKEQLKLKTHECIYPHESSQFKKSIYCFPFLPIGPPVDGSWSDWSDWGTCTVSCGQGQRNRYRLCNNPPAANGGALCVGQTVSSLPCNNGMCPVPKGRNHAEVNNQ